MRSRDVDRAVRVVMNGDVNGVVLGATTVDVWGAVAVAVDGAVGWAVRGAVLQSLNVHSHPALKDFLGEAQCKQATGPRAFFEDFLREVR